MTDNNDDLDVSETIQTTDVDLNTHDIETNDIETTAVELGSAGQVPRHGFFTRLYTGTGAFEVVGRRKLWFGVSFLIVGIAIASIVLRGFTFGIDFQGGTKMSFPRSGANGEASVTQVEETFAQTIGKNAESVVRSAMDRRPPCRSGRRPSTTIRPPSFAMRCSPGFSPRARTVSRANRRSVIRRCRRPGAARSPRRH